MRIFNGLVDAAELFLKVLGNFLGLVIVVRLLLLLLFSLLSLLLLLFLGTLLLDWVLEGQLDGYLVELLEVARHGDLDDRGVILEIEQELIQVHVHGGGAGIEENQVLLDLADAANGRLEHFFDIDSLLRVHHLIVALLEASVNVDILDVETGQVLEDFVGSPGFYVLHSGVVLITR